MPKCKIARSFGKCLCLKAKLCCCGLKEGWHSASVLSDRITFLTNRIVEEACGIIRDSNRHASSLDGQEVLIYNRNGITAKVQRFNLKTGKRELLREIAPADRAGLWKTYVYFSTQNLSELHLVDGLK